MFFFAGVVSFFISWCVFPHRFRKTWFQIMIRQVPRWLVRFPFRVLKGEHFTLKSVIRVSSLSSLWSGGPRQERARHISSSPYLILIRWISCQGGENGQRITYRIAMWKMPYLWIFHATDFFLKTFWSAYVDRSIPWAMLGMRFLNIGWHRPSTEIETPWVTSHDFGGS